MISGAVYRDGVARTEDGAVYVTGPSTVPSTAVVAPGAGISPAGLKVDKDGVIYVRFV